MPSVNNEPDFESWIEMQGIDMGKVEPDKEQAGDRNDVSNPFSWAAAFMIVGIVLVISACTGWFGYLLLR